MMKLKVEIYPRNQKYSRSDPPSVIRGEMEFDADMIRIYGERLQSGGIVEANKWLTEHAKAFAERELIRIEWKLSDMSL